MKASNKIATFFKYFVLILVGVIMIYPLLWMISATFKDNSEIFAGISLWIKKPTLDGYRNALNNFGGSINILQAMLNTYSYVIPKVICTVVSACIAAYGFGRFDFPGRKLLFNIMLAPPFRPIHAKVSAPPKSQPRTPARFSPPTASAAHTTSAFSLKLRAEESAR